MSAPGFCGYCGESLIETPRSDELAPFSDSDRYALWCAEETTTLVGNFSQIDGAFTRTHITVALRENLCSRFGTIRDALALASHRSRLQPPLWTDWREMETHLKEGSRIHLELLYRLCFLLEVSPIELLKKIRSG
jgi:hypothetical protein